METQAQEDTGGTGEAEGQVDWEKEMSGGGQADVAGARTPPPPSSWRRPPLCQDRGHTSETKPDSVFRSRLLRAPQRAQPPVGCG